MSIGGDANRKNLLGMYFEKAIRGYYPNILEGAWNKQVFIPGNYEIRFAADRKFQQLVIVRVSAFSSINTSPGVIRFNRVNASLISI